MDAIKQLRFVILLLLSTTIAGVLGYRIIEGWSFMDSLYMTVITLATVGYGETHPLTFQGRIFTIVLIMMGVGTITYGLSVIFAFVVEGALSDILGRRKMEASIGKLKDHIIVCGIGETGRHMVEEFLKIRVPFVVIDKDGDRLKAMERIGHFLYIQGDATDDEILLRAHIKEARGLAAVLPQDKDNIYVILTARGLNPNLRIVTQAIEVEDRPKLAKAGADAIVSPTFIGGLRMASEMVRPTVVSFLDKMLRAGGEAVRVEEARIPEESKIAGRTLQEAGIYEKTGLVVIAIARGESHLLNPGPETRLQNGDGLINCCSVEQLQQLKALLAE
jgi:voltage-gated potassium channel